MGTIGVAARGISHQKEIDGNGDGDEFEVRPFWSIFGAQHVIKGALWECFLLTLRQVVGSKWTVVKFESGRQVFS